MVTGEIEYHSTADHVACNKYKCRYCAYSSNRSFNLRKHEKSVHKPLSIDEAETHRSGTCGEMENVDEAGTGASSVKCTGLNFEKLEKSVIAEMNEFERKIELGRI